jgi:hypothetical protein
VRKKFLIWSAPVLVTAIGVAAAVEAFDLTSSSPKQLTSRETLPSSVPRAAQAQPPIPGCKRGQLAFSIRLVEKTPIAVLRHVRGGLCRQSVIPTNVRILPAAGAPEGDLLGPEDALDGLFAPGDEQRAAFRYRPTCAEQGPFFALVRAGATRRNAASLSFPTAFRPSSGASLISAAGAPRARSLYRRSMPQLME